LTASWARHAAIRNAGRDVAEGLRRFERDFGRLQREIREAVAEGRSKAEILRAANEAVSGNSDLEARMRDFMQRLEQAS
jgi:hypothetical protein